MVKNATENRTLEMEEEEESERLSNRQPWGDKKAMTFSCAKSDKR